jgi:hypothetical protein
MYWSNLISYEKSLFLGHGERSMNKKANIEHGTANIDNAKIINCEIYYCLILKQL